MFRPYFEAVSHFLGSRGIPCEIVEGRKLQTEELESLATTLDLSIPADLGDYLSELGDGFDLQWTEPESGEFIAFGLSFVEDMLAERGAIREQATGLADCDEDHLAEEAKRRGAWLPIIGIGEGGYEFCLDTQSSPAPIVYHDIRWPSDHRSWKVSLGASLGDLVERWSRYCFAPPVIDGKFINIKYLAARLGGKFDWEPARFDSRFDRERK